MMSKDAKKNYVEEMKKSFTANESISESTKAKLLKG